MKDYVRRAGIMALVLLLIFSLAACGQQATNVTQSPEDATKEVVVETAPPSPTPTPTPTPSVPPVAVTTVPMPMPSVTPTVSVTSPEGDAAATATASPTVSPSPTATAATGTTEYYSADAAFASTINPDNTSIPTGATNGYIVGNDVNFRNGPSASAQLIGTLDSGTRVRILGTENGWTEIVYSGKTGYVKSGYVSYGNAGNSSVVVNGSGSTMVIVPDGPANSSGAVIAQEDDSYFLGIKPD